MDMSYENILLENWEEIHKRSQLNLWLLLSLKDGPKHMAQVQEFIQEYYPAMRVDDKSIYRTLRRFAEADVISYTLQSSRNGPDRKIYGLTEIGDRVLREFLKRNLTTVFYENYIQQLILRSCDN